jgi:hypothetical protein
MPRSGVCFLGAATLALALVGQQADAQPLTPALCPVPPVGPFILTPPLTPFLPGQAGIPLLRRTIDTNLYPTARCNDGTPAVMYIRPANAAYAGNPIVNPSSQWIIFLDGGAACRDADSCLLERWCGAGGQIFDRAGKMSTAAAFDAIHGHGLFELDPPGALVNQFAGYNHVLVNYCSSDNWVGSSTHTSLNASNGTAFDIQFRGEDIVNAVIGTLLAGGTAPDPVPAKTFYPTKLPDLRDATEILLAGESAGGGGLRHHLDRLNFAVLRPAMAGPVEIRGVIDAGAPPHLGGAGIDWSDPYSPGDYADYLKSEVEIPVRSFWGVNDSALDQSCLDPAWTVAHDAAGGHPRVCYDTTYTLLNHITTPVFLREDINDPLGKQRYVDWNLYPATDNYWTDLSNQLTDFAAYTAAAGGLEPPLAAPGVQGPNCSRHVSIQTDDGFYLHRVANPGVPPRSFHTLLWNWVNGVGVGVNTQQIQQDGLPAGFYTPSICP